MSPASQASVLLIAANVVSLTGAWPVKIGRFLAAPDAMVALYDSPGQNPNTKWLLDFAGIQAVIRGPKDDYDAAYLKGKAIKDVLLGKDPYVHTNGDRWDGVTPVGDLHFLKYDDNSRPLFSVNFRIILEPATNSLTSRTSL